MLYSFLTQTQETSHTEYDISQTLSAVTPCQCSLGIVYSLDTFLLPPPVVKRWRGNVSVKHPNKIPVLTPIGKPMVTRFRCCDCST